MKAAFCAAVFAFFLSMAAALPAEAAFVVQTRINSGAAANEIAPTFRVKGNSTQQLNFGPNQSVRYFVYIDKLPITFTVQSANGGVTASVKRLNRTYTGTSGKNANFMVTVTPTANHTVSSSQIFDFSVVLKATDGRDFTQTDDWSYRTTGFLTTLTDNPNVVLADNGGAVALWGSVPTHDPARQLTLAKQKIKHVFVIVQENRSFDHYFGKYIAPLTTVYPWGLAFPGVDGIDNAPAGNRTGCDGATYNPAPLTATKITDPPHYMRHAKIALGCPQGTGTTEQDRTCNKPGTSTPWTGSEKLLIKDFLAAAATSPGSCDDDKQRDVVGYYMGNSSTDPGFNHWTIAKNGILQDKMFAPSPSFSLVNHLFLVSSWSARCVPETGANCVEAYDGHLPTDLKGLYGWKDITSALTDNGVSWKYYKGEKWNYNCGGTGANETCKTAALTCFNSGTNANDTAIGYWTPITEFKGVKDRNGGANVQTLDGLFTLINQGEASVPKVVWVVPGQQVSEHPSRGDAKKGIAFATMLIQRIMRSPDLWGSSAVFLTWDDWGGFYDHVRPPLDYSSGTTKLMYGIRVGGVALSPYLHSAGNVDHQTLSHDAYLKLIEDLFLNGTRLSGDARTAVRESHPGLGNLLEEFDFNRQPGAAPGAVLDLSCNAGTIQP